MAMETLRLWLALTPAQFEKLNKGEEVMPDEYSKRFGLRRTPLEAVERAQYFMDWSPDGPTGEFVAKDYVLFEMRHSYQEQAQRVLLDGANESLGV